MERRKVLTNNKGFTLIEIIAVLVILGILAAVAIPRYFDLQTNARLKAAQGAVAEAVGRVNSHFGQALLGGSTFQQVAYNGITMGTNAGDFILTYTSTANSVTVTANGRAGSSVASATSTKTFTRPGTQ